MMNETVTHLIELKKRLLKVCVVMLLAFVILYLNANDLFAYFIHSMVSHPSLVATEVTSTFTIPLKFSFLLSFFCTLPFLLYQIAAFMWPGLYGYERKWLVGLLLAAFFLFMTGAAFALWIVCPFALRFFSQSAPSGVMVMTELSHFYEFVIDMISAFGFSFELPVLLFIALMKGWVTETMLKKARPYVIVLAFVVGMILTPPDVISQITLAIPLLILFEGTLQLARWVNPAKSHKHSERLTRKATK